VDSHAYFLRAQGADERTVQAIVKGDVSAANLTSAETALLAYVKKVTEAASKTTPEDVQTLRDAGWTEDQIAEAVYITAMFAFFNRVADAFGIEPMGYLDANQVSE
jgi:alkylhydroperoxidase family enzyme